MNYISWSPDGGRIAFTVRSAGGPNDPPRQPLALWIADVDRTANGDVVARELIGAGTREGLHTIFDE